MQILGRSSDARDVISDIGGSEAYQTHKTQLTIDPNRSDSQG